MADVPDADSGKFAHFNAREARFTDKCTIVIPPLGSIKSPYP